MNIYDILEPCYHEKSPNISLGNIRLPSSFRKLGETDRPFAVRKRMFGRSWPFRAPVREGLVPTWPQLLNSGDVPCTVSCLIHSSLHFSLVIPSALTSFKINDISCILSGTVEPNTSLRKVKVKIRRL